MYPYVPTQCDDRDLQKVQDSLVDTFNSIQNNPILVGVNIIKSIFLDVTDIIINHHLGRKVTGFIIINSNAPQNIYQSPTFNSMPLASIILLASGPVTVDILFF